MYTGSWSGGWSLNITALEKSLLCQHPSRAIEDTVEDRNFTTQFQRCSEENPERTCRNCPSCPAKGPALPALKMVRLCHFCLAGWWFLSPGDFFFFFGFSRSSLLSLVAVRGPLLLKHEGSRAQAH